MRLLLDAERQQRAPNADWTREPPGSGARSSAGLTSCVPWAPRRPSLSLALSVLQVEVRSPAPFASPRLAGSTGAYPWLAKRFTFTYSSNSSLAESTAFEWVVKHSYRAFEAFASNISLPR